MNKKFTCYIPWLLKAVVCCVLFLGLGALAPTFALSPEELSISKHDLFGMGEIAVVAEVPFSFQQKFLLKKNSTLVLTKNKPMVGREVSMTINLKGYQGKPKQNQIFTISLYDSNWLPLRVISGKTDRFGQADIEFIPHGSMLGYLNLVFRYPHPFVSYNDPIFEKFFKIKVLIDSSSPHFASSFDYENYLKQPRFFTSSSRVNFGFSTRSKTDTLTRGSFIYVVAENINSKTVYIPFAARDDPRYAFG